MSKNRLEAFSDGVIAIIITIMVLELKIPQGADLEALRPLFPVLISYTLSFVLVGIYWNNHHHMLAAAEQINASILWANLHLLFWLSLGPFVTGWMGENDFAPLPVALYGGVMLMAGFAYYLLTRALLACHRADSTLVTVLGNNLKGNLSLAIYASAIPLAFVNQWIAFALYILVAIIWLIPDRRLEKAAA